MIANCIDISEGYNTFTDVKAIRVKNKKNNYLIMEDHTPIVGEVDGNITFITEGKEMNMGEIKGYFMHVNNKFDLIVEERYYVE